MKSVVFMLLVIVAQWIGWPPSIAPAADPLLTGDYVGRHVGEAGGVIGLATPEETWEEYRQHRIDELTEQINQAYQERAAWQQFQAQYLAAGDTDLALFCETNIVQLGAQIELWENELLDLMGL